MPRVPKYYVRPDGLHESILRIGGKRVAFRGRTDAEVWKKIKEYRAEEETPSEKFKDVAERWWNEIEPTLAPNSLKNYKSAYARAVEEFGKDKITDIQPRRIEAFLQRLGLTYAQKTVTMQLQIVRQVFRKAMRENLIDYNPAAPVQIPKGLAKTKRHAPPADQIQKIKDGASHPFGLFAVLIYYTGCRRGEALAMRGDHIDRVNKTVRIDSSVYYIGAVPHIKSPKTESGYRDVPLLPALDAMLPETLPDGYLFSDDGGKTPLTDHVVTRRYAAYQKDTGVIVSPHEIRHGYATALVSAGVEPKTAQTLLGHAQLSTTMDIYAECTKSMLDSAAEKMSSKF